MSDKMDKSIQDESNIVSEIVRIVMMLDHSKKPFKQYDITSHLNRKLGRNKFKSFFNEAKEQLNSIGLELVETSDSSAKSFFVISKQRPLQCMHKYATEEEVANRILLTLVLTYIFMKNGTVASGSLLNHLRDLNIYNREDVEHPYFGNVKKKVLNDFVEQLYLSSSKIPESDMYELSWGERAELEITKKSILEFVCQCGFGGKKRPQDFPSHFKEATTESQRNYATSSQSVISLD